MRDELFNGGSFGEDGLEGRTDVFTFRNLGSLMIFLYDVCQGVGVTKEFGDEFFGFHRMKT
jgi:hypothetical protein